jgi:alpha-beta hydrolase superfamily lysophospholipase
MEVSERFILNSSGKKIFFREWEIKGQPKKNILIIHGLGEHSGRYKEFAEFYIKKGIGVYALDLQGHGKSEGKRGHIKSFEEYLDSIENLLIFIRKKFLDTPIILFGHSLGGLIGLNFLIERESKEIESAVISSPWIETAIKVPEYLIIIQKILKRVFPSLRLNNRLISNHLSKNKDIVSEYDKDELVHNKISLKLYSEVLRSIDNVKEKASRIKIKTLLYNGKSDKIISSNGTLKISKQLKKHKIKLYENVYHEPHNDLEKEEIYQDILEFIKKI